MPTLLSFGHGYCAQSLARLLSDDWRVIGTTRSEDRAASILAHGTEPRLWPGADMTPALKAATHLLISAAPDAEGDPVLRAFANEIAVRAGQFEWVGYLSTTGVYGDHGGEWVTEDTPLAPSTDRGRARVLAETAWDKLRVDHGLPLHIFRLAGIYGPGRGPFAKVRNGTARRIVKPGQVFSRTHVEDIAQVLLASINAAAAGTTAASGSVYNVCDDDPAPPQDVIAEAARLLGLPVPEAEAFETAEMSPMARSFYAESKKVSNARIKNALGVRLRYPDYRSGLAALLATESRD